eukprot:357450-Chlamydomonas_euryale.AAC.3
MSKLTHRNYQAWRGLGFGVLGLNPKSPLICGQKWNCGDRNRLRDAVFSHHLSTPALSTPRFTDPSAPHVCRLSCGNAWAASEARSKE